MTTITTPRTEAAPATSRTQEDVVTSVAARRVLAALRLSTGFIFLWAFLDKTFGFGYSTASDAAWIHGGAPSQGFLQFAAQGPLTGFFNGIASPVSDVLFMLGIGTRVAAGAGSLIMAMMWLAEWPLISGSTNPVMDYHIIYALVLVLVALTAGGDTWGLGRWWKSLPVVQKNRWLI
jgi:thiosulfate dehydrogenase [quinone] large subunit